MPPKTDGLPRPKKVMTPEMLEKLAAARAKANLARAAMKSDNDELKLQLLQRKMDAIKNNKNEMKVKAPTKNEMKVKPDTPDQMPEAEPAVPEDAPKFDVPEIQMCAPEPEPVPNTVTPPASPVKAKKKKSKKPVVIVSGSSDSGSSDDNSNVIYIRRKSKSRDKALSTPQQPQVPPPPPPPPRREINPFFSFYHGSHRNFQ